MPYPYEKVKLSPTLYLISLGRGLGLMMSSFPVFFPISFRASAVKITVTFTVIVLSPHPHTYIYLCLMCVLLLIIQHSVYECFSGHSENILCLDFYIVNEANEPFL